MNAMPIWEANFEEIDWRPIIVKKKEFEKFYKENKNIKKPSCVSTFEDDDNYYIIDMSRWSDQEKRYFIESRKELYYSN